MMMFGENARKVTTFTALLCVSVTIRTVAGSSASPLIGVVKHEIELAKTAGSKTPVKEPNASTAVSVPMGRATGTLRMQVEPAAKKKNDLWCGKQLDGMSTGCRMCGKPTIAAASGPNDDSSFTTGQKTLCSGCKCTGCDKPSIAVTRGAYKISNSWTKEQKTLCYGCMKRKTWFTLIAYDGLAVATGIGATWMLAYAGGLGGVGLPELIVGASLLLFYFGLLLYKCRGGDSLANHIGWAGLWLCATTACITGAVYVASDPTIVGWAVLLGIVATIPTCGYLCCRLDCGEGTPTWMRWTKAPRY